jgi:hypothetical protein
MKAISSQQAREFWTHLHDQAESYEQLYLKGGHHAYKDEMRAAAETYDWLLKQFSRFFAPAVNVAGDIRRGLTAEGASEFLHLMDQEIQRYTSLQEQSQRQKQEALAKANDLEYYHVKRIYKETEHRMERISTAYRDSRERFVSIAQTEL